MKTVHYTKKFLTGTLKGLTYDDTMHTTCVKECICGYDLYVGKVYQEVGTGNTVEITKIEVF